MHMGGFFKKLSHRSDPAESVHDDAGNTDQAAGGEFEDDIVTLKLDRTETEGSPAKDEGVSNKRRAVPELSCLKGEYEGMSFPVTADEQIVVGRDPIVANIILKDPHISRKHCIIRYFEAGNLFYVVDMSSYGTFLEDGTRLEKGKNSELKPGTVICIGDGDEHFKLKVSYQE